MKKQAILVSVLVLAIIFVLIGCTKVAEQGKAPAAAKEIKEAENRIYEVSVEVENEKVPPNAVQEKKLEEAATEAQKEELAAGAIAEGIESKSKCSDSDGGLNYYFFGIVAYPNETLKVDACIEKNATFAKKVMESRYLLEYSCEGQQIYACPERCINGACKKQEVLPSCTDSDNGNNPIEKGTVALDGKEFTDYCHDEDYIIEYFCDGSNAKSTDKKCDGTCFDGSCLSKLCLFTQQVTNCNGIFFSIENGQKFQLRNINATSKKIIIVDTKTNIEKESSFDPVNENVYQIISLPESAIQLSLVAKNSSIYWKQES